MSRDLDRRVAEKLGWTDFYRDIICGKNEPCGLRPSDVKQIVPYFSTCHTAVQEIIEVVRGWNEEKQFAFVKNLAGHNEWWRDQCYHAEDILHLITSPELPHDICQAFLEVCDD